MKKRQISKLMKRIVSIGLTGGILLLAGCGGTVNRQEGSSGQAGNGGQKGSTENGADAQADGDKAMGRYVETRIEGLEDSLSTNAELMQMADGSLVFFDMKNGKFVSKDNGETWEQEHLVWFEDVRTNTYLMDVAVSPDGYVGIIYQEADAETEGENVAVGEDAEQAGEMSAQETEQAGEMSAQEAEQAGEVSAQDAGQAEEPTGQEEEPTAQDAGQAGEDEAEGAALATDVDYEVRPRYKIIAPDGTALAFEIPYEGSGYLQSIRFSNEGRLFGAALSGEIYEINKEDGSYELITELPGWVYDMRILDNRMACVSKEGITLIDVAAKKIVTDEALEEFVKSELGAVLEPSTVYEVPAAVMLEEDVLYLAAETGIYRHVIGGNLVEQIVDGGLTMLGNPSYEIRNALKLPDDSFLIQFSRGRMIRYTYNPDVPTVPDIQVKAYSLRENPVLKQAISTYQTMKPEVYVKYEVGMEADSSVTREDALKKLNTEIMAGKGPDVLILDNMPIDSYIDKGILMDLTPYFDKLSAEEYFVNVLRAFETEKGIYALPVQFKLPLIVGQEERIRKMTNLKAIADEAESIRKEKPEGNILGAMSEEELIEKLIPASASAWKKSAKEIDEAAVKDFFTEAVRIWNAEKQGITEEKQEEYHRMMADYKSYGMGDADIREYIFSLTGQILQYLVDEQDFAMGQIGDNFDFANTTSAFRVKGKTDSIFAPYCGQAEHIYMPQTIAGINAKSDYRKEAGELLELMLNDAAGTWGAFSVNRALWEESMANPYPGEENYGSMMVSDENGTTLSLDIYWPSEEEVAGLYRIAEEAVTPYIRDSVMEEAVKDSGVRILGGELDIDEGVAEIKKKLAIYMAE